VLAATLVGFSRVRLGVHYPGDVLVGQALAIVSVLALRGLGA
jgi:undecaprenyl-diphosphatase